MDDSFFQSLNTDTAVLTANRRLATYLQNEYARYQFNKKKTVWETPAIQPLSTWLNKLWEQLENEKTILSASQERALWKKISKQSWSSIPSIQQAWSLLSNWDIALDALKDNENLSVNKFYEWASEFASTCQSNHWLSSCEIAKSLINNPSLKNNLPKKIIIIGFDSVTPIIQELLEKLKNHIAIKIIETHNAKSSVKRFEFENKEDELTSMALWALKEYQNDPTQKIACVIPNLSQIRNQVVRIFSDVFNGKVEFNISAGQSLLSFLLTQTALQIIALSNDTIEDAQWSSLLQSPYLTTCPEDLDIAAEVDKKRCASNFTRIKAKTLLPLFTALQKRFPKSTYLKRWTQLIQLQKNNLEQETIENWIDWFVQILQALQWPGSRTLNSIEHQVMQRFLKALDELKETSDILGLMDFDEAYSLLQQFINDIVFQPKGEDAPIQILGVLETAGLSFDQLWLAGLDNENWPAKATPNPFLPHRLQMDCNMTHASAARELSFTESSMKRLLASAPYIMLSNANNEDDKKLSPSELITKYEKLNFEEKAKESITALPMENIKDEKGQPLTHNKIQGGTAVLKFQAICPFKAYAHFRLGAETIESPSLNLSAKLRGQLLHEALELIWKSIGTQAKLISLSEEALKETISNAIDESISHQTIPEANYLFIPTEKIRLKNIISQWLDIEKQRPPFAVIAQEAQRYIQINELSFHCRIDRIDRLENGKEAIIDYKSGYSNIQDWFTDRPPEPQLPIYCVFSEDKSYEALAFAQVRAGAMKFKGIASENLSETNNDFIKIDKLNNPDDIHDWKTLQNHWHKNLSQICQDFSEGNAAVDPLESACSYCELSSLCRVNECQ